MFELIIFVCIGLFLISLLVDVANKKPGLLYLLALPLAIVLLPIKLALDMLGGGRRGRHR